MSKTLAISMTCVSVALLVAVILMFEGLPDSWDAATVIVFSVSGAFMAARVPGKQAARSICIEDFKVRTRPDRL